MKTLRNKEMTLGGFFFLSMLAACFSLVGNVAAASGDTAGQVPSSFANLADAVKHSVVNISTTQVVTGKSMQPFLGPDSPLRNFFGDDFYKHFFGDVPQGKMKTHALGSGFVIDKQGLILTNNHVVEKATEIKVKLESGKEYTAKVLGRDPKTDLALIRVKPDAEFPDPVALGDSGSTRVGDWVMAVGNPFGLGETVTVGIVSAKGRIIGAGPYDDFLQTDAAINPGNSGGPLFNMKGQVVGINTAIIAQGQGIGFAIPSNLAKELLPQLEAGKIVRGWLGVMIQDITPELAKSFKLSDQSGVLIADVSQSGPAKDAGLQGGDVVTRFNGKEVANAHALSRMVAATAPGTRVAVDIIRDGKPQSIKVAVGTMPQQPREAQASPENSSTWGLAVQNITPELAQSLGLDADERGVVITAVQPGSPAADAELQPGDVIQEVDRQKVEDANDFNRNLDKARPGQNLLLLIKRGDASIFVALQAGADG
jgi:serine protease Do